MYNYNRVEKFIGSGDVDNFFHHTLRDKSLVLSGLKADRYFEGEEAKKLNGAEDTETTSHWGEDQEKPLMSFANTLHWVSEVLAKLLAFLNGAGMGALSCVITKELLEKYFLIVHFPALMLSIVSGIAAFFGFYKLYGNDMYKLACRWVSYKTTEKALDKSAKAYHTKISEPALELVEELKKIQIELRKDSTLSLFKEEEAGEYIEKRLIAYLVVIRNKVKALLNKDNATDKDSQKASLLARQYGLTLHFVQAVLSCISLSDRPVKIDELHAGVKKLQNTSVFLVHDEHQKAYLSSHEYHEPSLAERVFGDLIGRYIVGAFCALANGSLTFLGLAVLFHAISITGSGVGLVSASWGVLTLQWLLIGIATIAATYASWAFTGRLIGEQFSGIVRFFSGFGDKVKYFATSILMCVSTAKNPLESFVVGFLAYVIGLAAGIASSIMAYFSAITLVNTCFALGHATVIPWVLQFTAWSFFLATFFGSIAIFIPDLKRNLKKYAQRLRTGGFLSGVGLALRRLFSFEKAELKYEVTQKKGYWNRAMFFLSRFLGWAMLAAVVVIQALIVVDAMLGHLPEMLSILHIQVSASMMVGLVVIGTITSFFAFLSLIGNVNEVMFQLVAKSSCVEALTSAGEFRSVRNTPQISNREFSRIAKQAPDGEADHPEPQSGRSCIFSSARGG